MTNPATELHDLLAEWQVLPVNAPVMRARLSDGVEDWWPDHARAVALLDDVRAEVSRRALLSRPLRIQTSGALDRIGRGIFATNVVMENGHNGEIQIFAEADLTALELLGESWPSREPIHPAVAEGLVAFAAEARGLVMDPDAGLDPTSRNYLLTLIDGLERAVVSARDEDPLDVRQLASELVGALSALLAETGGPKSTTARDIVLRGLTWVRLTIIDKGTTAYIAALAASYATSQAALPGK